MEKCFPIDLKIDNDPLTEEVIDELQESYTAYLADIKQFKNIEIKKSIYTSFSKMHKKIIHAKA